MKTNKWRHAVLTWFTYTNTEKRAAMILVGLLFVLQITSWCLHYLPSAKVSDLPDPAVVMPEKKFAEYKNSRDDFSKKSESDNSTRSSLSLVPFDPDTASESSLVLLGMSPKQAASMVKFRSMTGGFDNLEELRKVRVLSPYLLTKWEPYLRFSKKVANNDNHRERQVRTSHGFESGRKERPKLNINTADTTLLMDLPFIGSGRARAIVNYRNRLGGFFRVEQLKEVRAIPDSVYAIIEPRIYCDGKVFRQLAINSLPADSLRHPYLSKQSARLIVNFREQHGPLRSIADLEKLPLLDAEILTKIAPYIYFNP
jgi:competence protein ComEA